MTWKHGTNAGASIDSPGQTDDDGFSPSDAFEQCQGCDTMDVDLVEVEGRMLCPRCVAEFAEERSQ